MMFKLCLIFALSLTLTLSPTPALPLSSDTCSCPESCSMKEELGRGTWRLLHMIVSHNIRTEETESLFYDFIDSLSQLYPCSECQTHFRDNLRDMDQIEMTEEWACRLHNMVNEQLDKPMYPCPVV